MYFITNVNKPQFFIIYLLVLYTVQSTTIHDVLSASTFPPLSLNLIPSTRGNYSTTNMSLKYLYSFPSHTHRPFTRKVPSYT